MMTIVNKLPEEVTLSQHLRERAPFFLLITSFGIGYYIAATPAVRQLLELDEQGKHKPRDRRKRWDNIEQSDALRDIVDSLALQVRDVVLAGVEENVTTSLLDEMRALMRPKVRGTIDAHSRPLLGEGGA